MKKIFVFLCLIFVFALTSCNNKTEEPAEDAIEFKMVSYAILTNEESLKNKTYSTSDFNLEGLTKISDCNEIKDLNNIDKSKYQKIIRFTFPSITEEVLNKNTNLMEKDNRIANYYNSNIELDKFNYDSLEKNIDFSKITFNEKLNISSQLDNVIINSIQKKEEYISYLNNLGDSYKGVAELFNNYNDDYFNNKSVVFIDFSLNHPGYYFDFTSMYLENNKLNLTFNKYQAKGANVQVITNRGLFIEFDNKLENVELEIVINNK